MADESIRTDVRELPERRSSVATTVLILLAIGIIGIVSYDAYIRGRETQEIEKQTVAIAETNQQAQEQLQTALDRVAQSDANVEASEQERVMWIALARASAGVLSTKPFSLYGLQRAVFGSADTPTRAFLRDYFKKAENLERVNDMVVYVAGLVDPPPQIRKFAQACQPIFSEPLPDMSPEDPNALWCYEFLKRREAEGGDVAAWQKLLAAASAEIGKKT